MAPAVRAAEPSRDGARDHLGRQIVRKLAATGKSIHSIFDLDGKRIAEYERDPVAGTSTLLREYIWLGDEPVAVVEGGTLYFVRADHIGRPSFATDATGSVVWSLAYLPFGEVRVSTGSPIDARFPGQWYQAESGLYQNWMRDYDPSTGRYLQPDPRGLVDGPGIYGYALQNPGRWTDPTGEFTNSTMAVLIGNNSSSGEAVQQCSVEDDCYDQWMEDQEACRGKFRAYIISDLRACMQRAREIYLACVTGVPENNPWTDEDEGVPKEKRALPPPLLLPIPAPGPKGFGGGGGRRPAAPMYSPMLISGGGSRGLSH